jgi:aspartyl/glutamyl-tRNA(Asn/Gln) amidotransferase C subunit
MNDDVIEEVCGVLAEARDRSALAADVADLIRRARGYRWVGVYEVGATQIEALGWSGAGTPAFLRFPVEEGLCGAAAASGETVVVADVRTDPRYLTTFGSTRSEIVVPVRGRDGVVRGLIDVESDAVDAFGAGDRALLERCATALESLWEDLDVAITREEVLHVAELARLALTEEEIERLGAQLGAILEAVGKVSELELEEVEPTSHPLDLVNVWADDEPRPSLPLDEALANASERESDAFKVPPSAAVEDAP